MILWKTDFTNDDPFFRLSFDPGETKASMVHNKIGEDIQTDESPYAILDIGTPDGVYCVGTWEAFLIDAKEEQVKHVKDYLDKRFSPIIY